MTTKKSLVLIGVALVLGVVIGSYGLPAVGTVNPDNLYVKGDLYQKGIKMISNGVIMGPISSANTMTISALVTLTGGFKPDSIGSGVLNLAATSTAQTLTAAQVCDNSVINWPTVTSTGVITLPTAVALQADCLSTNGGSRDVIIRNTDSVATSSFSFTAGASSTVISNMPTSSISSVAVAAGKAVRLTFVSATSTLSNSTMIHILANLFN